MDINLYFIAHVRYSIGADWDMSPGPGAGSPEIWRVDGKNEGFFLGIFQDLITKVLFWKKFWTNIKDFNILWYWWVLLLQNYYNLLLD